MMSSMSPVLIDGTILGNELAVRRAWVSHVLRCPRDLTQGTPMV
jgi:hypothetical protein